MMIQPFFPGDTSSRTVALRATPPKAKAVGPSR